MHVSRRAGAKQTRLLRSLLAYRPGTWAPDGLTRLYRTTDTPNNLAVGLGLIAYREYRAPKQP